MLKKVEQTIFIFLYLCQTVLNSYYNCLNACLERNCFFFKGKNVFYWEGNSVKSGLMIVSYICIPKN